MWKKVILGAALFILVFIGAALTFNFIMNRDTVRKATEGANPTMPYAYAEYEGRMINGMQAYTTAINTSLHRDTVIPVSDDKIVKVYLPRDYVDGSDVKYQLRSFDGKNLIEDGDLRYESDDENYYLYYTDIRMDMTLGAEYSFVIDIDGGSDHYYYYTRIVRLNTSMLSSFLDFAINFSNAAFEGNAIENQMASNTDAKYNSGAEAYLDMSKQREENRVATTTDALEGISVADITSVFGSKDDTSGLFYSNGGNTITSDGNPGYVTLGSSYEDVTYSGMKMERFSEPIPIVKEVTETSALIELKYKTISEQPDGTAITYAVSEYLTLEYDNGKAANLVTGYARYMNEDFNAQNIDAESNSIILGITSDNNPVYMTNEKADKIAFLADNSLWFYDNSESSYTNIFGTTAAEAVMERMPQEGYGLTLVSMDDNTVDFVVYGRINEGRREGSNGVLLYEYNIKKGTLQELCFIDTDLDYQALSQQTGRFCYYDKKNTTFYTIIGESIVSINTFNGKYDTLIKNIPAKQVLVSEDMKVIAYPDTSDQANVSTITIRNLEKGTSKEERVAGHKLALLGFVGNDIMYASALPENIETDADGTPRFMFDELFIVGTDGNVLKDYSREGVLISKITFEDSNIVLTRVGHDPETGALIKMPVDNLSFKPVDNPNSINVKKYENDAGLKITTLKFPGHVYVGYNPEEIMTKTETNNNEKVVKISGEINDKQVYVYNAKGLVDATYSVGNGVQMVSANGGFVADSTGRVIYREKQSLPYLTVVGSFDYKPVDDAADSLAACKYMCARASGLPADYNDVRATGTWAEAFELYGDEVRGINISGVSLNKAISFLSDGAPFAAKLGDRYVLVVSYNSEYIRYYDPVQDTEVKKARYLFDVDMENNGYEFYTYVK